MPINKPVGQPVTFTATFFDASNVLSVPSSATLTIVYPLSSASLTTTSCALTMAPAGSFFTVTWASSVAAAGLSSYTATAPGQITNAPGLSGTLRLI